MGNNVFFNINFLTRLVFFSLLLLLFPLPFQVWAHPDGSRPRTTVCSETVGGPGWTQPCFCEVIQLLILCSSGFFSVSIKFFPLEINSDLNCAIILLRVCKIFRKCDLRYLENPREHNLTSFVPILYDRGYFNMDLASETLETGSCRILTLKLWLKKL